jgi:hypothetical protein
MIEYVPVCSVLRRSKSQCSTRSEMMKIRMDKVRRSGTVICIFWAADRRRAGKNMNMTQWDVWLCIPLQDFRRPTRRVKSCVRCWTTAHKHATVSCNAWMSYVIQQTNQARSSPTWTPPAVDGFKIMGCNASCSSLPNLAAVLGMCGIDTRKILRR